MFRLGIAIALATALAFPAYGRPKVTSDTLPGVNFAAFQTFTLVNATAPSGMNPVAFERIRQGVEAGLSARGYSKGDPGDLSVVITIGARDKTDIQTWGRFGQQVDVRQYTEGQMAVDVFDTKTKQPLWHGAVTDTVTPGKLEPAKIEKAVSSVMSKFPARTPPAT